MNITHIIEVNDCFIKIFDSLLEYIILCYLILDGLSSLFHVRGSEFSIITCGQ